METKKIYIKRKTSANEWLNEYPDLKLSKIKRNNEEREVLSCKYCGTEFAFDGHISSRLKEHINVSKKHKRLKAEYLKREESGKQLTIPETQIRLKERQEKCESGCHEFVHAISLSGLPLNQANGYLGKYIKKWVFAARDMPTSPSQLSRKYLPEVYRKHIECIKESLKNKKITIIIDESPDIMGRKTVNTLFSFFDSIKKVKSVLLVDTSFIQICNNTNITTLENAILLQFDKKWSDVIAISTDSASYMECFFNNIKERNNFSLSHINDISHLIHIAVNSGFKCSSLSEIRNVILKFGNLFINAYKMKSEFDDLLKANSITPKKPNQVAEHRWFSYYRTAKEIVELWSYLNEFIGGYDSKKVSSLKKCIGDETEKLIKFVIINATIDLLDPIVKIQISLETGHCISHKIYSMVNEMNYRFENLEISQNVNNLMRSLSLSGQKQVKATIKEFCNEISGKWKSTSLRNLDGETFGSNGLFKKLQIFDPFLKSTQVQSFQYYKTVFMKVLSEDQLPIIEQEFIKYLIQQVPENTDIDILNYWIGYSRDYPLLSQTAITFLCMACGSIDAERSFSKLRHLEDERRTNMNEETLKMQMILYFNGDIEDKFADY